MGADAYTVGAPSPQEGTTSNRYAILGRIATGGMAEIFLARSTSLAGVERYVVLKRVLPERARDPIFVKMFLDEARLAAQLQHPNIAQVHDIGRLGDSYFFTMEYVHGEDLRAILQRLSALRRPLPVNHALLIAAGAAAALHHAHERTGADRKPLGIVHRDVSPSNVMVSFEGAVKLVDFGVAKASQRSTETRTGTVKGKIAYLSPEQCKGAPVDRRSDIFSLGIVLYELLTCTRLFKRETDFATMTAIVNDQAPPPSLVRPELGPAIDHVVATALARDPVRRYATAGEMLEGIEEAAERAGKSMSAHGLGRFLRELFGERPEPWIELNVRDDAPEIVTVTSQSVLSADALAGAGALPSRAPTASPLPLPLVPAHPDVEDELRRTMQLRKAEPEEGAGSGSGTSMPGVAPIQESPPGVVQTGAPTVPRPMTPSIPPPMPGPRPGTPSAPPPWGAPMGGSGPQMTIRSASAPPPMGAPGPATLPYPPAFAPAPTPTGQPIMPTGYPSYASMPRSTVEAAVPSPPRSSRRGLAIIVGVSAVAIGIGIGIFAAGDDGIRRGTVAPAGVADTGGAVDARSVVITPVDDPEVPASAVDAAPVEVAVATPPDAAPARPADTAATAVKPRDPPPRDPPPRDPPPRDPPRDPAADRAAAVAALVRAADKGDWAGAWKGCSTLKRRDLTDVAIAACAEAACGLKKKSNAVSYWKDLPAKLQRTVEKSCAARGIDVKPPAKKDPCEANPLSCQH
jgi:serine/threonine protein kinase